MPSSTQVVSLALVLMAVAFLFPAVISGMNDGTATSVVELNDENNDVANIENAMRVELDALNGGEATMQFSTLYDGQTTTVIVAENETTSFQLDNQTITVDMIRADNNHGVLMDVSYPVDMGWTPEADTLSHNLPIVFVAIPLVIVAGFIAAVVRS